MRRPWVAGGFEFGSRRDWNYALNMIETICWLAGPANHLDTLRETIGELGLYEGSRAEWSARLFAWLVAELSYQGISDQAARAYMARHGIPGRRSIAAGLKAAKCPLLASFWDFHGCGYRKIAHTYAFPPLLEQCPLPKHRLRNGSLNQLAYSLFLFIRDVAGGDLVGWIDAWLTEAEAGQGEDRLSRMQAAILEPLTSMHGASRKVLSMALSALLLGGKPHDRRWAEVGGSLIAVDSLVHNFFARSGILARANAKHLYGARCYGSNGCAGLIAALSRAIDARQFNDDFPQVFPRYIQLAIWRYCSAEGFNICNGVAINDSRRCENKECRLFGHCDSAASVSFEQI
jgi:hypothetical protein